MTVYVLSHFGDVHAHAVHWACENLGKSSVLLDLYEFFENSRIGIIPENGRQRLLIDGIEIDQSASVWLRRPNPPKLFRESSVHASDLKFAEMSCASLYRGFLEGLSECSLVVSPWTAHTAASLKMNQISAAQRHRFGHFPAKKRRVDREKPQPVQVGTSQRKAHNHAFGCTDFAKRLGIILFNLSFLSNYRSRKSKVER